MSAGTTQVWVTYIVHARRPDERYPWRKCGRTVAVELSTADVDQAFRAGARQLGAELAGGRRKKGRGRP